MKKLTTILLSVLLIASLFVSCDNAATAVQDELAEVTLSTQAAGRSLTVSNPLESLSSVAWSYKATKVSETQFNYGEKTSETNIELYPASGEKQKLTLSQGKWVFELFGRSKDGNNTLLYHGMTDEVLILKGLNHISVEVSPYTDALGQISFSDVKLVKADGTEVTPNYLYVTGPEYTIPADETSFNGTKELTELKAGQYTVTVAWKETITGDNPYTEAVETSYDVIIASETIVVTVYGGRTTEISGNISEETGSGTINGNIEIKTEATQQKTVVTDTPTTFTVNVAPANSLEVSSVENTTVSIDFDQSVSNNSVAVLSIDVKNFSESFGNPNFEIAGEHSAVAGINLALDVIDQQDNRTTVSSFDSVVIETYIVKGLSEVSVKYKQDGNDTRTGLKLSYEIVCGDDISSIPEGKDGYYNPSTGKLVFRTDHFSEYYVEANSIVAINYASNTVYSTIQAAINAATDEDTIYLLKNIESGSPFLTMTSGKKVNLDLGGHELNYTGDSYSIGLWNQSELHLSNGTVTMKCGPYYGIYVASSKISLQTVTVHSTDSGIFTTGSNSSASLNDCYIESVYSAVYHNGSYAPADITIINSTLVCNSEDNDPCVYISNSSGRELQTLVITDSRITGPTAVEVKHTKVTITGSTLEATKENVSYNPNGNGNTTVGYCLAITGNSDKDTTTGTVYLSGNTYKPANPGCEVFNSSAVNGVNNGVTIEGYDNAHVLSPDKLMPVCRIKDTNTVYYSAYDLRNATAATLKNKTVILQSDEVLSNEIYLSGKAFTLDLNGHSLTLEYGEGITPNNGSVIFVAGKYSKLTIIDSSESQNGSVYGSENNYPNKVTSAVRVGNYGKLVINGGNYYGMSEGTSCIFVCTSRASSACATVTINGGYFSTASPSNGTYFVLNHEDSTTAGCKITVNGGKFKNYNPGVTAVDPVNAYTGIIVLGTGCSTTSETNGSDTYYTVSKKE